MLHQEALNILTDPSLKITSRYKKNWHCLFHPWRIRPVADKWIYGALPKGTCQVATYPHFCLEAEDSALHKQHVGDFHKPSREMTLDIWKENNQEELLKAQEKWDNIRQVE